MLPDDDELVGTMLGKDYRVLQQIGAGGMAVVYLVEHQTLLKRFAAKVLSPQLASSLEARARFTQEAHAASQLDHENIVTISDFGVTADHRPFFVMELLRGETLDQRLAEGPMSIEEVVAVCVPVARALAHAHAEGIVHLDVKPENIFLVQRSQGRWGVKVVDFGIAKTPLDPQDPRIAKTGETVGSPMFMAPEVCSGADDIDQRADVYSFGILLYLMMCGRLPFVDDSVVRVLQMQLIELPPPPREVNTKLSPELAAVVERALAKHPDDRYPSMEALLRDLDAALPLGADHLLIEAQSGAPARDTPFPGALSIARHESQRAPRPSHPLPPSGVVSRQPPAPRSRGRAILIPSMVVAIAGMGALLWWQMDNRGAAASGHDAEAVATRAAVVEPVAASHEPPSAARPAPAQPTPVAVAPAAGAAASEPADVDKTTVDTTSAADPKDEPAATIDLSAIELKPEAKREAKLDPGSAKKLPARVRSVVRPELRPTKRSQAIAPTGLAVTRAGQGVARAAPVPVVAASDGSEPTSPPTVELDQPEVLAEVLAEVRARELSKSAAQTGSPVATPATPVPPVAPTPAPVVAPAPSPVAPSPVVAAPIKAPPNPGPLDAVPAVTTLEVKGSLSPSIVRRSIDRTLPSLRACYRSAARAAGATPVLDLQLTFEIDENGLATQVAINGPRFSAIASCAAEVARKIRTQGAPDVGTVQVTVGIRFRPS